MDTAEWKSGYDLTVDYKSKSKIPPLTIRIFAKTNKEAIQNAQSKWEFFPPTKESGTLKIVGGHEEIPLCKIVDDLMGMPRVIELA